MDNQCQSEQNARNSLKILFMAADLYLKAQDELGRNFIQPQIQAAGEILNAVLNERWPADDSQVPSSE